jgi:uncharacterized protein YlxP (DUF503 family)
MAEGDHEEMAEGDHGEDGGVRPRQVADRSPLVFVGVLEIDLLLGDIQSLKEKRSVVRPIVAEVRRKFEVAAAESGHLELHRRSLIGVSVVAAEAAHCVEVMDACERLVAARPEIEVLSTRQRLIGEQDE